MDLINKRSGGLAMILKKENLLVIAFLLVVITLVVLAGCSTKQYEVKTEIKPEDAGSVTGSGVYEEGEQVTIKAEPEEGYKFEKWLKNGEVLEAAIKEIDFKIGQDKDLVAQFSKQTYEVKLEGNFDDASLSGEGTYSYGEKVEVKAKDIEGLEFIKWKENGEKINEEKIYQFEVTENRELTAIFGLEAKDLILKDELEGHLLPIRDENTVGFINPDGEKVVGKSEHINFDCTFHLYQAHVPGNNLYKEVGQTNPLVLSLEYDEFSIITVFNKEGKLIASQRERRVPKNDNGIIAYEGGKYGFIDYNGNQILDFKYDEMALVPSEMPSEPNSTSTMDFLRVTKDGNKGIAHSADGEYIINPEYDHIRSVRSTESGLYRAEKDKGVFLYDRSGEMILDMDFDEVRDYSEGMITVRENEQWGFIDLSGKFVIEPAYDEVMGFYKEGVCLVKQDGKWGIIDTAGEFVVEPVYDEVFSEVFTGFSDPIRGYCRVKQDGKWGLIDTAGEFVIEPEVGHFSNIRMHEIATQPSEVDYHIQVNSDHILLDSDREVLFEGESIRAIENKFMYEKDGKIGLLSKDGEVIEDPVFEEFISPRYLTRTMHPEDDEHTENYAAFKKNGLWAFFKDGEFQTDFMFEEIVEPPREYDGVVQVIVKEAADQSAGLYDIKNDQYIISPAEYDEIGYLKQERIKVIQDGKYGFVDKKNRQVTELKYDQATSFVNEAAAVIKNDQLIIIDKEGSNFVEPVKIEMEDNEDTNMRLLEYFDGPGVYKSINLSYFDEEGWIEKPD